MAQFAMAINAVVFLLPLLLGVTVLSCICVSIKRSKKLQDFNLDNFVYMRLIRVLLIFSTIFLFLECIGFLLHYSFYHPTHILQYDRVMTKINITIVDLIHISDILIYFSLLCFLLCSIGAYYIALHRFLLTTTQESHSLSRPCSDRCVYAICIICYLVISCTAIALSVIHLFFTLDSKFFYILLICFDLQLMLSSIPVFKSLHEVIQISRDSARSVRWSVTSVSPTKLYYKMSVKAVRMGMEHTVLNLLLCADIGYNVYQIYTHHRIIPGGIPSNIHYPHIIILYMIQIFVMLFTVDYTWINRKSVTPKTDRVPGSPPTPHRARSTSQQRRSTHSRQNLSDFDYRNTVLMKPIVTKQVSSGASQGGNASDTAATNHRIVKLKAAANFATLTLDQISANSADGVCEADLDNLVAQEMNGSPRLRKSRSSSVSVIARNRSKVNEELAIAARSLEDMDISTSKDSRSVLAFAKRMSKSFVESVINVDTIWDEEEEEEEKDASGPGTPRSRPRFSRFASAKKKEKEKEKQPRRKSRKKRSFGGRRHSLPTETDHTHAADSNNQPNKPALKISANLIPFESDGEQPMSCPVNSTHLDYQYAANDDDREHTLSGTFDTPVPNGSDIIHHRDSTLTLPDQMYASYGTEMVRLNSESASPSMTPQPVRKERNKQFTKNPLSAHASGNSNNYDFLYDDQDTDTNYNSPSGGAHAYQSSTDSSLNLNGQAKKHTNNYQRLPFTNHPSDSVSLNLNAVDFMQSGGSVASVDTGRTISTDTNGSQSTEVSEIKTAVRSVPAPVMERKLSSLNKMDTIEEESKNERPSSSHQSQPSTINTINSIYHSSKNSQSRLSRMSEMEQILNEIDMDDITDSPVPLEQINEEEAGGITRIDVDVEQLQHARVDVVPSDEDGDEEEDREAVTKQPATVGMMDSVAVSPSLQSLNVDVDEMEDVLQSIESIE